MEFIQADKYRQLPREVQLSVSYKKNIAPINPIFIPIISTTAEIVLLYGSYGSGKSVFIADYLIYESLNNPYFKCLFGRKVFDTIRISVFDTICERIEFLGLKDKFTYKQSNASSLRIRGNNGAQFIPFGADNPGKLKSVKDPTHIFCEEFDQFTQEDFGVLFSRLRIENAKKQFLGAFNTTAVTKDHWIYNTFIENEEHQNISTLKIPCNYTDNAFINHKEYEDKLWISAGYNEQKFREIAHGEWGTLDQGNAFIWAFRMYADSQKEVGYSHVTKGLSVDYALPVYLSFDFNVEPITCIVCQHDALKAHIKIIQEYRLLNSDIFELCSRIKADHPAAYFIITGDASGQSRSALTRGNRNYYQTIQQELMITLRQINLPTVNPSISDTRMLVNAIFAKHKNILIDERCRHLIEDLRSVEVDDKGGINKTKDKYKGHLLDTLRYYLFMFHKNFIPSNSFIHQSYIEQ